METGFDFRSIIVVTHAFAAAVGVGSVIVTDYIFFKFLKDYRITKKEVEVMRHLSEVIWGALAGLVLTGVFLVSTKPELFGSPKFLLKMVVVGVIVLNGIVLNIFITPRLRRITFHESRARSHDLPDMVRKIATVCGAISISSWLIAFLLGSIKAIPFALVTGVGYYFALVTLIAIFASLSKVKK